VLAGLVVLGTLLAAVAIARGRFLRQWADADRRVVVTQAADRLLARWFSDPVSRVPVPAQGSLEGLPGYDWQTSIMQDPASTQLGAVIVRLQVFNHNAVNNHGARLNLPVLAIDVLVHKPSKVEIPGGAGVGRPAR
jgi:hypothetical protein